MQAIGAVICLFLVMLIGSCTVKKTSLDSYIAADVLKKSSIQTQYFDHVLFSNNKQPTKILYVYFGGDGKPWLNGQNKAKDPTGENNLTLSLMAQVNHPAIFIARPCYFGTVVQVQCSADLWTNGRYSERVLTSMEEALILTLTKRPNTKLVLIGYSGGGVIASILANRVPNVVALVTIAANLDIDLWTKMRGYQPLYDSLNPIDMELLNKGIIAVHLIGEQDTVVPNEVTLAFVQKHGGLVWRYANYGHLCCWQDNWPEISEQIANLVR